MQKVLIDPEKPFENGEQTSLPGIMIQPKAAKKIPENERMSPNKKDNIEKERSRPTIILGELLVFGGVSLHKRRWVKYFSSSERIQGSKTHMLEHTQDLLYSPVEIKKILFGVAEKGKSRYILGTFMFFLGQKHWYRYLLLSL